jgi:four helix bundle protein
MAYQDFKELRVWQEGKQLAIEVYKITGNARFSKDYGLRDQVQRAAVSIASNIAEGYERNSHKDFVRYLLIAKGSLSELRTQMEIALEIGHIDENVFEQIEDRCKKITGTLINLIKARRERYSEGK